MLHSALPLLAVFTPLMNFLLLLTMSNYSRSWRHLSALAVLNMAILFAVVIYSFPAIARGETYTTVLGSWILSDLFEVNWVFAVDALTYTMLIVVLGVSTLVHLYSTEYMSEDPHTARFISYLSLFTFFMLLLVTSNNFVGLFLGWEGVGLCSYLLISFWFTRIQANKAMVVNRVSDLFFTVGILAVFLTFQTARGETCTTVLSSWILSDLFEVNCGFAVAPLPLFAVFTPRTRLLSTWSTRSCNWRHLVLALLAPVLLILLSFGFYHLLTAAPASLPAEIIVAASKAYVPKPGTTAYYCGYPHGNYTRLPLGCPTEPLPFSRYFRAAYVLDLLPTLNAANARVDAYNECARTWIARHIPGSVRTGGRFLGGYLSFVVGNNVLLHIIHGCGLTPLLCLLLTHYLGGSYEGNAALLVKYYPWLQEQLAYFQITRPLKVIFIGSHEEFLRLMLDLAVLAGSAAIFKSLLPGDPTILLGLITLEDLLQHQEGTLAVSSRTRIGFGGSTIPASWEFPQNPLAHPLFVSQRLPSLHTLSSTFSTAEGRLTINYILSQTPKP